MLVSSVNTRVRGYYTEISEDDPVECFVHFIRCGRLPGETTIRQEVIWQSLEEEATPWDKRWLSTTDTTQFHNLHGLEPNNSEDEVIDGAEYTGASAIYCTDIEPSRTFAEYFRALI